MSIMATAFSRLKMSPVQIAMIHRPWMHNPEKHAPTEAQWIIGKNRFGRLGRISFKWTAELTKYEEEPNNPTPNKS